MSGVKVEPRIAIKAHDILMGREDGLEQAEQGNQYRVAVGGDRELEDEIWRQLGEFKGRRITGTDGSYIDRHDLLRYRSEYKTKRKDSGPDNRTTER